jgi:hypothetical protein
MSATVHEALNLVAQSQAGIVGVLLSSLHGITAQLLEYGSIITGSLVYTPCSSLNGESSLISHNTTPFVAQ